MNDFINDFERTVRLLLVGLLTAVIIYPLLHETGHLLATVVFGGKVVEFNLFPIPNILCDVVNMEKGDLVFVGFGGVLFPLIVSLTINTKRFMAWYVLQLIKCISVLALIISLISLLGQGYGICVENDDAATLLSFCPELKNGFIVFIILLLFVSIFSLFRQHPFKHLYKYFGIIEK